MLPDEAISAMDLQADRLVQDILSHELKGMTV
jgi:hypothetical protein